jgi:PLP dependent protein
MQSVIGDRLIDINNRLGRAAKRCGRAPETIRLVAVTKNHPVALIRSAIAAGITAIGENYIQEARSKFDALIGDPLQWHFIGHLQSNKAKYAVRMFELIHTVDSIKLAAELDLQAKKAGKLQHVLIQVNIGGESTKAGAPERAVTDLMHAISAMQNIKVKGLMTMPPYFDEPEKARPYFAALKRLSDQINALNIPRIEMAELSMGMTGDFETAIEEGATLVRIGTALFGERQ